MCTFSLTEKNFSSQNSFPSTEAIKITWGMRGSKKKKKKLKRNNTKL